MISKKIIREIKRPLRQLADKMGLIDNWNPCSPIKNMTNHEIEYDRQVYLKLNTDSRFEIRKEYDYICKNDKYNVNGSLDNGYFIQDIWGARKVYEHKPNVHYDVGSSVAGFIAHLLSIKQKIQLIDIRCMNNDFDTKFLNDGGGGVTYTQADATKLEYIPDNSIESLSALCSIEHFGLGRYGDSIDPMGWEKALKSFQRKLKPKGKLYISVPIGKKDKVCFNAHRVYRPQTIIDTLDSMDIVEMGYIQGFDIAICMQYCNNKLQIYQNNYDSIPDILNAGVVGLFEFKKKVQ